MQTVNFNALTNLGFEFKPMPHWYVSTIYTNGIVDVVINPTFDGSLIFNVEYSKTGNCIFASRKAEELHAFLRNKLY